MAKKKVANVGLKAIVEATLAGSFVHTLPAEHKALVDQGLVEVNPAIVDANGGLATRATQTGIAQAQAQANSGAAPDWKNGGESNGGASEGGDEKPTFKIEDNIPIPNVAGRGRTGESIYPFDQLQVGQSFFIPKESKNLASTISSANARYSEEVKDEQGNVVMRTNRKGAQVPTTKLTRQFVVRSVTENGVKGSRIWRKA